MTDNALKRQVGGDHYKGFEIQPVEFIEKNNLGFLQGCIVKRIARYNHLGGKGNEDLEKIKHEADLLIELSNQNHEPDKSVHVDKKFPPKATPVTIDYNNELGHWVYAVVDINRSKNGDDHYWVESCFTREEAEALIKHYEWEYIKEDEDE